jgi:hypothetical protein
VCPLDKEAIIVISFTVRMKFPQPITNFTVDDHLRGIGLRLVPDML